MTSLPGEFQFVRLKLSSGQLGKLAESEQKLLFSASLITNDIKFLMSLFLACKNSSSITDLRSMQNIRWLWLVRKLASSIFEAQLSLRKFAKDTPYAKKSLDPSGKFPFLLSNSNRFLSIAKKIRDDSTYHYDPKKIVDKIKRLDRNEYHFHWKSESGVNSISGFHDSALLLSEFASNEYTQLNEFAFWCYHAAGEISAFCEACLEDIMSANGFENQLEVVNIPLEDELSEVSFLWPLVISSSR